jgi:hypothetical protein
MKEAAVECDSWRMGESIFVDLEIELESASGMGLTLIGKMMGLKTPETSSYG